ncbi:calmodulin-binding protein [Pelomyxa schiedti]|nr:calmodulin-binding protein [Pelomyxa schiedti]
MMLLPHFHGKAVEGYSDDSNTFIIRAGDIVHIHSVDNDQLLCCNTDGIFYWIPSSIVTEWTPSELIPPQLPLPPVPDSYAHIFSIPAYNPPPPPVFTPSQEIDAQQTVPQQSAELSPQVTTLEQPQEDAALSKKKGMAVTELIETEKVYVNDLQLVIEVFINPLKQQRILPEDQIALLFGSIESISGINSVLLQSLVAGASVPTALVSMLSYLKVYSTYCANIAQQLATYNKLYAASKPFKKFMDTTHKNPKLRKLDLVTFLSKPMQRICKYPLLLREILRYTSPLEPDYNTLKNAAEKISQLVSEVNERKRKEENSARMFELQNLLFTPEGRLIQIVKPTRKLLIESEIIEHSLPLTAISDDNWSSGQTVRWILFSDVYIRATQSLLSSLISSKLTLKSYNHISDVCIHDLYAQKRSKNPQRVLLTLNRSDGSQEQIMATIKNEGDKKLWMDMVASAKVEIGCGANVPSSRDASSSISVNKGWS